MTGTLFIFLKAPVAGRVKTRLGRDIGLGRAAALFRVMTAQTIARASAGPWRTVLAVDPPTALAGGGHLWPLHLDRVSQASGNLGQRMGAVFNQAPRGPTIIIGADAPDLRAHHIRDAFNKLGSNDAVFGPADDGGYWLIGLAGRRAIPGLFDNVRWSTEFTLNDTMNNLPRNFSVAKLSTITDIDEGKDLKLLGLRSTR